MWRAFPPNCFFAHIAGTLVFTESNAMSPCSPLAASTKLFSQGALESQLDFGRDFDGKSAENRSKIGCGSAFPLKSAGESLWGAFWPRFSHLGGTFGRSGVPSGDHWGSLGRLWGAQVESRMLWGPSWDPPGRPVASRGRSGRVFAAKTTKNGDSCTL